ncbi:hypothetical protein F5141DRAFT_496515 [Pisolithus sp. B1]|nr:hypothetical protein F5141DRAFT_496515 [Pisolithus sp. B1]
MPAPSESSAAPQRRLSVSRSTSSTNTRSSLSPLAKPRALSNASDASGCTTVKPSLSTSSSISTSKLSIASVRLNMKGRPPNPTSVPLSTKKKPISAFPSTDSQSARRLSVPPQVRGADPVSPSPAQKGRHTSLIGPPSSFPRSLAGAISANTNTGAGVPATPSRTRVMSDASNRSRSSQKNGLSNAPLARSNSVSTSHSALSPSMTVTSPSPIKRMQKTLSLGGDASPMLNAPIVSVGASPPVARQSTPRRPDTQGTAREVAITDDSIQVAGTSK